MESEPASHYQLSLDETDELLVDQGMFELQPDFNLEEYDTEPINVQRNCTDENPDAEAQIDQKQSSYEMQQIEVLHSSSPDILDDTERNKSANEFHHQIMEVEQLSSSSPAIIEAKQIETLSSEHEVRAMHNESRENELDSDSESEQSSEEQPSASTVENRDEESNRDINNNLQDARDEDKTLEADNDSSVANTVPHESDIQISMNSNETKSTDRESGDSLLHEDFAEENSSTISKGEDNNRASELGNHGAEEMEENTERMASDRRSSNESKPSENFTDESLSGNEQEHVEEKSEEEVRSVDTLNGESDDPIANDNSEMIDLQKNVETKLEYGEQGKNETESLEICESQSEDSKEILIEENIQQEEVDTKQEHALQAEDKDTFDEKSGSQSEESSKKNIKEALEIKQSEKWNEDNNKPMGKSESQSKESIEKNEKEATSLQAGIGPRALSNASTKSLPNMKNQEDLSSERHLPQDEDNLIETASLSKVSELREKFQQIGNSPSSSPNLKMKRKYVPLKYPEQNVLKSGFDLSGSESSLTDAESTGDDSHHSTAENKSEQNGMLTAGPPNLDLSGIEPRQRVSSLATVSYKADAMAVSSITSISDNDSESDTMMTSPIQTPETKQAVIVQNSASSQIEEDEVDGTDEVANVDSNEDGMIVQSEANTPKRPPPKRKITPAFHQYDYSKYKMMHQQQLLMEPNTSNSPDTGHGIAGSLNSNKLSLGSIPEEGGFREEDEKELEEQGSSDEEASTKF